MSEKQIIKIKNSLNNEKIALKNIDSKVFGRICNLITIWMIMILISMFSKEQYINGSGSSVIPYLYAVGFNFLIPKIIFIMAVNIIINIIITLIRHRKGLIRRIKILFKNFFHMRELQKFFYSMVDSANPSKEIEISSEKKISDFIQYAVEIVKKE